MKNRDITRAFTGAASVLMLVGVILISLAQWNIVFAEMSANTAMLENSFGMLNLSEQQKNTIADIFGKANEEIRQVIAKASGGNHGLLFRRLKAQQQAKSMREQIQSIRAGALNQVRGQLNPSQQATFDQLVSKAKENQKQRADMLNGLNLEQQQKSQVAKITENAQEKAWDVWANKALSSEQQEAQLKEIIKNTDIAIRGSLNAEQQAKFDAWPQQNQNTMDINRFLLEK